MRSRHVDRFNHDPDAAGYDEDVRDETDPIRAGYAETLRWVAAECAVRPHERVLELGSGTGNLTVLLGEPRELVCVDVSREMSAIGRRKLSAAGWGARTAIRWLEADLLEAMDLLQGTFDVAASTYVVHHLTEPEKDALFAALRERLRPGGRVVFGDLMFESAVARRRKLDELRAAGDPDSIELAATIEDEFFWDLERALQELRRLGFEAASRRFSELSFGVTTKLPA